MVGAVGVDKSHLMKLVIQIPCLNEAETLGITLRGIPKHIPGINVIETVVIDDGSTDGTSNVARELGVPHIIRFSKNHGLASAFRAGIQYCLEAGADIIVNLDGDNQYPAEKIPELIAPLLAGEADIVIGNRNPEHDRRHPMLKRLLYKIGRVLMNSLCSYPIPDPVSGFRALSRNAAMNIHISSSFSYTLEMIIQAEHKHFSITYVPITTNAVARPSRLFRNMPQFLYYSARTIIETYLLYKPLKFFSILGVIFLVIGILPILRFLLLYMENGAAGHVQSLVLGSSSVLLAVGLFGAGLVSHLIAHNRILLEQLLAKTRHIK